MSDNIKCKELAKNRAYLLMMGDVQISALKLEGYKASQLGGTISPYRVGAEKTNIEGADWLLIVKDKNDMVMPYSVGANRLANEISMATGSSVNTVSVLTRNEVKANGEVGIGMTAKVEVKELRKA